MIVESDDAEISLTLKSFSRKTQAEPHSGHSGWGRVFPVEDDSHGLSHQDTRLIDPERTKLRLEMLRKQQNRDAVIFNMDEYEENVFWRTHCQLEQESATSTSSRSWFSEATDFFKTQWYDALPDQSKLDFWQFRMFSSQLIAFRIIFVDLAVYILSMVWVIYRSIRSDNTKRDYARLFMSMHATIWSGNFLLLGAFFVAFKIAHTEEKWARQLTLKFLDNPTVELYCWWQQVQVIVTSGRFITLLFEVFSQYLVATSEDKAMRAQFHGDMCLHSYSIPMELSIRTQYLGMCCVDFIELMVLCVLPIDWIYIVGLSITQTAFILIRVLSCVDFGVPTTFSIFLSASCAYVVVIICLLTSWGLEAQLHTCFEQFEIQKKDSIQKLQLVNVLCTDIKLPIQELLQTFRSMHDIVPKFSGVNVQKYVDDIESHNNVINGVIDGVLFVAKMEDHPFSLQAQDRLEMRGFFVRCFDGVQLMFVKSVSSTVAVKFGPSLRDYIMVVHSSSSHSLSMKNRVFAKDNAHSDDDSSDSPKSECVLFSSRLYFHTICQFSFLALLLRLVDNNLVLLREVFVQFDRICEREGLGNPMFKIHLEKSDKKTGELNLDELHVMIRYSTSLIRAFNEAKKNSKMSEEQNEGCCGIGNDEQLYNSPRKDPNVKNLLDLWTTDGRFQESKSGHPLSDAHTTASYFTCCASIALKLATNSGCSWAIRKGGITFSAPFDSVMRMDSCLSDDYVDDLSIMSFTNFINSDSVDSLSESVKRPSITKHTEKSIPIFKPQPSPLIELLPRSAFALLNDSRSESPFLEIVHRLPGGSELSLFSLREIFPFMASMYEIAFVQNVEGGSFLRAKGFLGYLVLVSERLAYLEDDRGELFDVGCPIPCNDQALTGLVDWLLLVLEPRHVTDGEVLERYAGSNMDESEYPLEMPGSHWVTDMRQSDSDSDDDEFSRAVAVWQGKMLAYEWYQLLVSCLSKLRKLIPSIFSGGLAQLPKNQRRSYHRWRYLNARWSIWHHSMLIDLSLCFFFVLLLVGLVINYFVVHSLIPVLLNLIIIIVVKNVTSLLVVRRSHAVSPNCEDIPRDDPTVLEKFVQSHFPNPLRRDRFVLRLWRISVVVLDIANLSYQVIALIPLESASLPSLISLDVDNDLIGRELVFLLIVSPALIRTLGECTPWPWSFALAIGRFLCSFGMLIFFILPKINSTMTSFLTTYSIIVHVMVIAGLILRERLARKGFRLLYNGILARDFRDRLLIVTRVAIANSLSQLVDTQRRFLLDLGDKCVSAQTMNFAKSSPVTEKVNSNDLKASYLDALLDGRSLSYQSFASDLKFLVTLPLLQSVSSFQHNASVIQELAMNLEFTNCAFISRPREKFIADMKAHFTYELAERVARSFDLSTADVSLQVLLRVSPSLTMIRLDDKLFSAILCSLCRRARGRILAQAQQSVNFKNQAHEIIIWLRASDDEISEDDWLFHGGEHPKPKLTQARNSFVQCLPIDPCKYTANMMKQAKKMLSPFDANPASQKRRFTAVRTMVITVLDTAESDCSGNGMAMTLAQAMSSTGSPQSSTERIKQQRATVAATALASWRESGTSQNKKNFEVCRTDPLHNLGDMYGAMFDLPSRSRQSALAHSRYHTFQQASLPYLLCPDSHKLCEWRSDESHALARISGLPDHLLRSYKNSFVGIIDDLIETELHDFANRTLPNDDSTVQERTIRLKKRRHVNGSLSASLRTEGDLAKNKRLTSRQAYKMALRSSLSLIRDYKFRPTHGVVGIFTHLNLHVAQRSAQYREMFASLKWNNCVLCNLRGWPTDNLLAELQCIIIDMDLILPIREKKQSQSKSASDVSKLDTKSSLESILMGSTKELYYAEYDAMDLLHYIRCRHYNGVVVFAKNSPTSQESAAPSSRPSRLIQSSRSRSRQSKTALLEKSASRKSFVPNPYAHGAKADLEVELPLDLLTIQKITELCDIKQIKALFQIDDV